MSRVWTGERLARLPLYVFAAFVVITGGVFIASSVVLDGGWHRAWEIMVGLSTPFRQDAGLGMALSVLGYVFVPTAIGLAVADGISRFTRRNLMTLPEARGAIADAVTAAMKASSTQSASPPPAQ